MSVRRALLRCATLSALFCFSVTGAAQQLPIEPGMAVKDLAGGAVGTVVAVRDDEVTVRTDQYEVRIPASSTIMNNGNLLIAMTRTELNAAIDRTRTAGTAMPTSSAKTDPVAMATLSE